jgi:hypothetical protein
MRYLAPWAFEEMNRPERGQALYAGNASPFFGGGATGGGVKASPAPFLG